MTSDPKERARKAQSLVLARLSEMKQVSLATAMGTSESTINRIKTERLEEVLQLIAHLGFKLVDQSAKVVDADAYAFLTRSHAKVMARAPELVFEQDED